MSIFQSMPETPDLGPLMEAFKTMAQMNLFEDQPGMHWGLKIFMGVMIILLIVGVTMLSYWWATNQKKGQTIYLPGCMEVHQGSGGQTIIKLPGGYYQTVIYQVGDGNWLEVHKGFGGKTGIYVVGDRNWLKVHQGVEEQTSIKSPGGIIKVH